MSNTKDSQLMVTTQRQDATKVSLSDVFKNIRVKATASTNNLTPTSPEEKRIVPKGSTFKISTKTANALRTGNTTPKTTSRVAEKEDIEIYHDKKIKYFESLQKSLPSKRKELVTCIDPVRRALLEKEIASIESREEETTYFLQVYDILAEYRDVNEQKPPARKLIEDAEGEQCDEETENEASSETGAVVVKSVKLNALSDIINKRDTSQQQMLMNAFYRTVDPKKLQASSLYVSSDLCEDCDGVLEISNGVWACMDCGTVSNNAVSDFKWSYKDIQDIQYKSSFAYKRITRFCDLLNSWQAKENTEVPEAVVDAVRGEIEKDSLRTDLGHKKVRYYLKRTNNCKYYEHWAYIVARITGESPLKISAEIEEELIRMFKAIQDPFEEARREVQPDRKSFLSYSYVCYKFFELLGMYDKLDFFTLLKSPEKLGIQDKIWKAMCEKLNWTYHRST